VGADPTVTVSVVIPTLNGAATLGEQLEALTAQSTEYPFEVIVVDNGSTDATVDLVAGWAARDPRVRLVTEAHRGPNIARNSGVRAAVGDRILLCDCDDIVAAGWVQHLADALGHADLVGGPLDTQSLNHAETRRRWGVGERLELDGPAYGFLWAPYGANCGFTRAAWERVGGFDERFSPGGEDFAFFWRAQLAGCSARFVLEAIVAYRLRADWQAIWRRQYRFGKANVAVFAEFRAHGLPRSPTMVAVKGWLWSLGTAPLAAVVPRRRPSWIRTTAKRAGRLVGSVRHRAVYL
jgi:glycosyltransferase involved in cell wall biosynthesis